LVQFCLNLFSPQGDLKPSPMVVSPKYFKQNYRRRLKRTFYLCKSWNQGCSQSIRK